MVQWITVFWKTILLQPISATGIYRHRSYDNLQNGKSLSPAYRLTRNLQLPHSPSFDRNSPLPLLHKTVLNNNTNLVPVPSEFKFFSPQRRNRSDSHLPRYPYHKNRAVPRQNSEQSDTKNRPFKRVYKQRPLYSRPDVHFELKSPTNRLTIRECDFGGGGDSTEFDTMLRDSQTFRISKRTLYEQNGSPGRRDNRFSNVYEYGLNIDLNSIIEDVTSDSS